MKSLILFTLTIFSYVAFSSAGGGPPSCGINESFICGCFDKICGEPQIVCVRCTDGCFCNPGFVRAYPDGPCIPEKECPAPACSGPNESFYCKCADSVCNQPDIFCIRCEDACHCNEGFVRDVEGGTCIPTDECPAPPPACEGPNEVQTCKCADSVCNQPDVVCKRCLDGCYCAEGFVRDVEGGTCIPIDQCPVPPPTCEGPNEVYDCQCEDSVCPANRPRRPCRRCRDGCYCADGYVRDVFGGTCIPVDQCFIPPPPTCEDSNEVFECRCADSVCNKPDKVCVQCLDDCYCVEGFVRDVEGGKCIPVDQCPTNPCQDPNEVLECVCSDRLCGVPVEDSICFNGDPCFDNCVCRDGYLRENEFGACVPIDQCPPSPEDCKETETFTCKCADSVCNQPDKVCVQCIEGCYCEEGLVRDVEDGTCIPADQCPFNPCQDPNEMADCRCGESSCDFPDMITTCPDDLPCMEFCFCKPGYLRDERTHACVLPDQCSLTPPPEECEGPNEVFECKCRDPICNRPYESCIKCSYACHCAEGFVRDFKGGACIPADQCPPNPCKDPNEIFDCRCSQMTCSSPKEICTPGRDLPCYDGCYCKKGFLRDDLTRVCIPADQCPEIE